MLNGRNAVHYMACSIDETSPIVPYFIEISAKHLRLYEEDTLLRDWFFFDEQIVCYYEERIIRNVHPNYLREMRFGRSDYFSTGIYLISTIPWKDESDLKNVLS